MSFSYNTLDRRRSEVRLVRFTDYDDTATSPIQLEMRHASLDDEIQYTALSYAWGEQNKLTSAPVYIGGKPFVIGHNLHAGLMQLRENRVQSWLWVDAICIAQSDNEEKTWQVALMRDIYSRANLVYLWLGPGSEETDRAMDLLCHFGPQALAECPKEFPMDRDIWNRVKEDVMRIDSLPTSDSSGDGDATTLAKPGLSKLIIDMLTEPSLPGKASTKVGEKSVMDGINDILERDYWHRIWIIQEVTLAKDAVILCGGKSVPIDVFHSVLRVLKLAAVMSQATRGMSPPPQAETQSVEEDNRLGRLSRPGCVVDLVTEVMQPPKWERASEWDLPTSLADPEAHVASILAFANLGPDPTPGEDHVWRTITADCFKHHMDLSEVDISVSEEIASLARMLLRGSPIDAKGLTSEQRDYINKDAERWKIDECNFEQKVKRVTQSFRGKKAHSSSRGRTLFKTLKGMFGLGHVFVRPGDVVTLLWGIDTPIILRPRDEHRGGGFTYVGNAYVDGIMEGEFLETRPAHQTFDIY
ncbi:hypothetical protein G7Z17_g1653 [Cylindrodendrum hubeiense]|uniref:Heterokaryon incompatibility domain-containing protein n=1 Tax=Cylindrodendrum hubeiense TaxID=595255 RepID=A0A9P5HL80_9HYPO|nr:hypothetical protein G7Z17_g1653 [Cylindrodendrum hubeiense]